LAAMGRARARLRDRRSPSLLAVGGASPQPGAPRALDIGNLCERSKMTSSARHCVHSLRRLTIVFASRSSEP
jgi:hypothetical protein